MRHRPRHTIRSQKWAVGGNSAATVLHALSFCGSVSLLLSPFSAISQRLHAPHPSSRLSQKARASPLSHSLGFLGDRPVELGAWWAAQQVRALLVYLPAKFFSTCRPPPKFSKRQRPSLPQLPFLLLNLIFRLPQDVSQAHLRIPSYQTPWPSRFVESVLRRLWLRKSFLRLQMPSFIDVLPAASRTTMLTTPPSLSTPQNTPAATAPISSHAQQPGVASIKEGECLFATFRLLGQRETTKKLVLTPL